MVVQYFIVFKDYLIEVLPFLAIGFLLSGLIHEFIPSKWVERHLGGEGIKPLLYATLAGTVLPICCFGALPVAVTLHWKGARLGSVLAFLVATPATSVTSLLVSYGLLGAKFVIFEFFAVITMGLVMGLVGNAAKSKAKVVVPPAQQALDTFLTESNTCSNMPLWILSKILGRSCFWDWRWRLWSRRLLPLEDLSELILQADWDTFSVLGLA